jgi:glyoxylase-like metal-dependent hydrolase (beta-lactamase superfamily II)
LLLLGLALAPAASAQTAPGDLVKAAVAAEGGAEALKGLKTLAIKGIAKRWEPEQSVVPGGEPRFCSDDTVTIVWDLAANMARADWDRAMKYPAVSTEKYAEIVTPRLGYVAAAGGNKPMSGIRLATSLRELERASPLLLVKALEAPQSLSALPDQPLGGTTLPAVAFNDGGTKFTILFDRASHLPAAIRTLDDDNINGDSRYDLVLGDWKPVGGVKLAHALTYKLNGVDIMQLAYQDVAANGAVAPQAFDAPEAVRQAAKPPATGDVPYQWVLRRLNIARFTDSDAVNYDAASAGGLKLVELGPNVQQVVGGSHNSLIVAMKDGLVVVDAPINEWQSRWTIDQAKAKYPGKPVKYLVLTHHHMDHTGGTRTYVAEGATIVVPTPAKAYFEKVAKAPHTVSPDELQKSPKPVNIAEVAEQMSIKDETGEVRLYRIANPHVDGMLIAHVMPENLLWVTDLYSPGRDKAKSPGLVAVVEAEKKLGIAPARYAGGHGGNGTRADLEALLAQN